MMRSEVSHPVTGLDDTLRSVLRCPDCRGQLAEDRAVLSCAACGHAYPVDDGIPDMLGHAQGVNLNEVATQDHVSDFYELERYQRPHSRAFHRQSVENMCRMVRLDGMVLDNGCGNGFLFDVCNELGTSTSRFVGVDISSGMLDKARRHHSRLVRGDGTRLPFADKSFDTIFARSLLHHLPDPEAGVREMARVLKPGGELVVLDTHKTFISTLPRAIANRGEHFDEDHKNFRTRELTAALGRHLSIERVEFMGYVAYPLLGFPDLLDFSKYLPLRGLAGPLIAFDQLLSRTPVLRHLGWGVIVKAQRAARA